MTVWLYAASQSRASERETLALASESGFIWRSFYNKVGSAIACARDIKPGDELLLGYRNGGSVNLLARFRVGRPDQPITASPAFGEIPTVWVERFREQGYENDPMLGVLVGIFLEEIQPLSGQVPYKNWNAISILDPEVVARATAPAAEEQKHPTSPRGHPHVAQTLLSVQSSPTATRPPTPALPSPPITISSSPTTTRDGIHIGIDVGGRKEKGFDLCITDWREGLLKAVDWKRIPHATPLPQTSSLRAFVRAGDLAALAAATADSAHETAAALWRELRPLAAAGIYIDSPSAFSRNRVCHGRSCEKRSLQGVSFQSTPSIASGTQHGGDWGWLVYGMVAFAACLHHGELTEARWFAALEEGNYARCGSSPIILRECFPTASISALRTAKREPDVEHALGDHEIRPEVQAVVQYLRLGVKAVKRPGQPLYDRADALVAALGALPHVSDGFREVPNWATDQSRWTAAAGDDQVEGTFICVV